MQPSITRIHTANQNWLTMSRNNTLSYNQTTYDFTTIDVVYASRHSILEFEKEFVTMQRTTELRKQES